MGPSSRASLDRAAVVARGPAAPGRRADDRPAPAAKRDVLGSRAWFQDKHVPPALRRSWPLAVLAGLLLAFFWPLLRGRSFSVVPSFQNVTYPWAATSNDLTFFWPQSDQAEGSYPYGAFVGRALREGVVPFWEPHSFGGGFPVFSNGNTAIAYPPHVLTRALFDTAVAHDLFILAHVAAAGLFTYLFARRCGLQQFGALLAASSWMFGSFHFAWVQLTGVTPLFALMPLGLYTIDIAIRERSVKWSVVTGWVLAALLLAGNLLYMWVGFLAVLAYGAGLALFPGRRGWRPALASTVRLTGIALLSVLASAAVMVPTFLSLSAAGRQPFTYEQLLSDRLMSVETLRYVWEAPPLPVSATSMYQMVWYGSIAGILATIGLIFGRGRGTWGARAGLALSIGIAVGTPLTWLAYHVVPGFNALQPYNRLLPVTGFALVILAGVGFDLTLGLLRGSLPRVTAKAVPGVAVLLLLVNVVPQIAYAGDINPGFTDRDEYPQFPRTPALAAVAEGDRDGWPARVLQVSLPLGGDAYTATPLVGATPLAHSVDSLGGYDSAAPARTASLLRVLAGEPVDAALAGGVSITYPLYRADKVRWELAERVGVELVYAPPRAAVVGPKTPVPPPGAVGSAVVYDGKDGELWRLTQGDSRPYLVSDSIVVEDEAAALRAFIAPEHDYRASVVLEAADSPEDHLDAPGPGADLLRVASAERGVNTARVEVDTASPSWLVLPINYDAGWSASVDGEAARVIHANYTSMAVRVPAGEHSVELVYRPPGLLPGLLGLAAAIASSGIAVVVAAARRRRTASGPRPGA